MRWMKWIGIAAAIVLCISCFQPWVVIESKQLTLTGMDTTGTNYGKPGILFIIFSFIFLVFSLIPSIWSKRANMVVAVLNLAWGIRNYFLISTCSGGECPQKKLALYLVFACSIIMLLGSLFPDMQVQAKKD
jgi:hypothetical protein